jgi:hypothetical protein
MIDEGCFLEQVSSRNEFRHVPIRLCNCNGVGRFRGGRDSHAPLVGSVSATTRVRRGGEKKKMPNQFNSSFALS